LTASSTSLGSMWWGIDWVPPNHRELHQDLSSTTLPRLSGRVRSDRRHIRSDDIQAAETTDDGIASPSHCDSHFNQSLQVTEIAIIAAPHTPAEGGRMPTRVIDDVVGRQDSNAVVCRRRPAEASAAICS